jgi:hypothetical protein
MALLMFPAPRQTFARLAAASACAVAAASFAAAPAHAEVADADQVINSGTLIFLNSTPGDVSFQPITLNGANQTSTPLVPQNIRLQDARGVADSWKIDMEPTRFTHSVTPANQLPANALSIPSAPAAATCLPSSTCTPATNTVSYALPVDASPAPATTIYSAAADTGRGQMEFNLGWQLNIPADTAAGTYNSTWTYTLNTAP